MDNFKQKDMFGGFLIPPDNSYIISTALQSELPQLLPDRILFTGVGKVNATHALTRFLTLHPEVKTVINYGTAGAGYGVKKGEIVKCGVFVQGDMYCGTKLAKGPGITFGDPDSVAGKLQFSDDAICRTQDSFVENLSSLDLLEHLLDGDKFNCVDMEAYALAKVCFLMERDFICYKYISDDATEGAGQEWHQNVAKGEPLFYEILQQHYNYTMR